MAIILRIDVDSSYGKKNILFHLFSRLSSDFNLGPVWKLPYLEYLYHFINYLNSKSIQGYFFFRKCTMPTRELLRELIAGGHIIGLHLENSRSFETFKSEVLFMENTINSKIEVFSKHGSGRFKYGYYHHPPYEPAQYLDWGFRLGLKTFFGNLEDPTILPLYTNNGLLFFPAAFWLEHHWRDIKLFDFNWLIEESKIRDIVLLVHVENLLINKTYSNEMDLIIQNTQFKVL